MTLVFSWPLNRMPTPRSSSASSKCGLRGSSESRSGRWLSGRRPWARLAGHRRPSTRGSVRRTAVGRIAIARAAVQSPPHISGGFHMHRFASCSPLPRLPPALPPSRADPAGPAAAAEAGTGRADEPETAARTAPRLQRSTEEQEGRRSGTSRLATAPAATCRSTPAPAPGCRSTSRPTAARSRSTCSATSMSCRSAAARRGRLPPAMPGTCSRATRPSGTEIAFTSDRGGGDNIWVMGRDGSQPAGDHQRELPAPQPARMDARRRVRRRAQAFHRHPLARRRRDVALPPLGA